MAAGLMLMIIPVLSPGEDAVTQAQSVVCRTIGAGVIVAGTRIGIRQVALRITVELLTGITWFGLCVVTPLSMVFLSLRGPADTVVAMVGAYEMVKVNV
ncbi:hypothetical protein ACIA5D_49085 [Actinoplanes sp. NPDC051513]|uniref:hypothetical protein n=1 Tax=Actinoplanes sp. NPDC051513 TaxID=3363908 RepID=UPI0037A90ABE